MNKEQLQMLSVKSAVERAIQGYIAVYEKETSNTASAQFFDEIERYIAMLYVSRQVDRGWIVRPVPGSIEVTFVSYGQHTRITYAIPAVLQWRQPPLFNLRTAETVDKPSRTELREIHKTAEVKLSELIPHLEAAVEEFIQLDNTSVTRQAIKNKLRHVITQRHTPIFFWLTCDETNNPPSVRDNGQIKATVEIQFSKDDPTLAAVLTLNKGVILEADDVQEPSTLSDNPKAVAKSDPLVADFMIDASAAVNDLARESLAIDTFDFCRRLQTKLNKSYAAAAVHDFTFSITLLNGWTEFVVYFDVTPYHDSLTVTLPIHVA